MSLTLTELAASVAKPLASALLNEFKARRRQIALDELFQALKKAHLNDFEVAANDEDIAVIASYIEAAESGMAKANLRILARYIAFGYQGQSNIFPDEFVRFKSVIAQLSYEEIIVLILFYNEHKKRRTLASEISPGAYAKGTFAEFFYKIKKDEMKFITSYRELEAILFMLTRTGFVTAVTNSGHLQFQPTVYLEKLISIIDIENINIEDF